MLERDQLVMSVHFNNQVEITALHPGNEKDWLIILRGIAAATGCQIQDFQIIGASKTSPFKIDIVSAAKNVVIILSIFNLTTQGILNTQKIQNNRHDLKPHVTPEKVEQMEQFFSGLESDAINDMKEKIDRMAKELSPKRMPPEEEANFQSAIKKLIKFIHDGGDLEFITLPSPETEGGRSDRPPQEITDIKNTVKKLEETKRELRLIEHKDNIDQN